jgi:DNA polymerase I-like protein with 3'-5' exonuclease and polymerase domains
MDLFDFLEDTKTLKVEPKPWMTGGEYTLARATNETLPGIIDACIASGRYALDLETTGLNSCVYDGETVSKIVGCCLSPDGKRGYYIPLRHRTGTEHNVSWSLWKREMLRLVGSPAVAVFHNGKFDQEFLQNCGGDPIGEWDEPKKWDDTLILAYLRDTRSKSKGLKHLSKTELGMEMIELDELFPEDKRKGGLDFSELDPSWEPVTWYGASDAICTWNLYRLLAPQVLQPADGGRGQALVYTIEKLCVASTRWMERARIFTNQDKARELIRIGQREWIEVLEGVYESSSTILGRDIRPGYYRILRGTAPGYESMKFDPDVVEPNYTDRIDMMRAAATKGKLDPLKEKGKVKTVAKRVPSLVNKGHTEDVEFPVVYDVLSAQQLGALLRECKVPGLSVTEKSGQVDTSRESLESVLESAGDKFPFAAKIKRFREVSRALSTYLIPVIEDAHDDGTLRAYFNAFAIETGRFNSTASRSPEVDGGTRFPFHATPATYDPSRPECLARVRECIAARPGKVLTAIDFSGVELRIVTNMSGEPKWLREFFHCSGCDKMFVMPTVDAPTPVAPPPYCPDCGSDKIGDLHTLTAIAIYGDDAPKKENWKQLRGFAKGCNFALCYGGGGNAVVTAVGCDKNEGWRIKEQFDKTYKTLSSWWKQQILYVKKHKYAVTAFGRRYHLPDIDHEMGGFRAKAERNAVNGPVQGTSADITKIAMGLIYKECKKRGWLEKVHMLITMHDELVFEIDKDILEEAIDLFVGLMCRNDALLRLGWAVPLTSDVEMGPDWTVPWDLKKIRKKGECPKELDGCFKGVGPKVDKPKSDAQPIEKPAEMPVFTHRVKSFSLGEIESLARLIAAGSRSPKARLRVEGPNGEDLTGAVSTVWGGKIPMVGET